MKKIIVVVLKLLLPTKIVLNLRSLYTSYLNAKKNENLKSNIIKFHANSTDIEVKEIVGFLVKNDLQVFPYDFTKKYKKESIEVFLDEKNGLKYVIHENKKLYFKRKMSSQVIRSLYSGLLIDQDDKSPHLYLTDKFDLKADDIIADIGAAEGNFSLSNVDRVKKIYIFEYDLEWIEALKETFKPWAHKVEIIPKFVTNYDSDSTININTFYNKNDKITFFKVDIEGEEQKFIDACKPLFESKVQLKIVICTYHKEVDEKSFTKQFVKNGFQVSCSNGYMIFYFDNDLKPPYLRRGLLRCSK